ncbi:MAG: ribonuclease HII [Xanthomonadaceae bacterium]|nr:ribonuclease HII [Xanthomonadaceae bacterium]
MNHFPTLKIEHEFGYPKRTIIGLDEVGRGCIAGPVVAAAAVLPAGLESARSSWSPEWLRDVQDSKKLSVRAREELSEKLKGWLAGYSVAYCSSDEIDEINIHHASLLAMDRALEAIPAKDRKNAYHLVDGKWLTKSLKSSSAKAIIKGDLKCLSIACASIIAKVHRDQWMERLDQEFQGYGLAKHKGYPTAAHVKALGTLGVTSIHRKTFGPVSRALQS